MLTIADFILEPRLREVDTRAVNALAAPAFELASHFDLASSPLVHALFWLRTLPERWSGRDVENPNLHVDQIGKQGAGFRVLAESPTHLIVGAVGQFWKPEIVFADVPAKDFASYDEPGWGKVVWELRCDPEAGGSTLVFELRVAATDEESWHKVRRYFRFIGPFSRFIRRHELNLMARKLGEAESDEQARVLDGDDLIARPRAVVTDSIVIDAPPAAVWPWLLQMGRRRAGWYSYDILDNGGVPSATEVVPELQQVAIGDVWPAAAEGHDGFAVVRLQPERVLVLGALVDTEHDRALALDAIKPEKFWEVSWAFVLEPTSGTQTRLWARVRADYAPDAPWKRLSTRMLGLAHHFMEREQLNNIKLRAEGKVVHSPASLVGGVAADASECA